MRHLIVLTVGALLLASCNGGGTVTPPTEQPNPPIETPPPSNPNPPTNPTTPTDKPLYVPNAGAAVGSGDGTKEGTVYIAPTAEDIQLLTLVNEVRTKGTLNGVDITKGTCVEGSFVPLNPLTYNGLYAFAARKHADYVVFNNTKTHYENDSSSPYFYGITVKDRVQRSYLEKAGISKEYEGDNTTPYGGELLDPAASEIPQTIIDFMHSPNHCKAMMRVGLTDIGTGRGQWDQPMGSGYKYSRSAVLIVGDRNL